jgi:uncharacterized phage-associated protein
MQQGVKLAYWILARPNLTGGAVTHLKLQKLVFYCYGGAAADGLETELGSIEFEAWKHGPVCRAVYEEFCSHGAGQLPSHRPAAAYSAPLTDRLADVLGVYGGLDAWALRHQSHLEDPWISATTRQLARIDTDELKTFFQQKFGNGRVACPDYVVDSGSLRLDRIPVQTFSSLKALAAALQG